MTSTLANLKAAFARQQPDQRRFSENSNNYYPFWDMEEGQRAVVRFLPDLDTTNPWGFLVEKLTHNLPINGQQRRIPCGKMHGEDCPICKVSRDFYKAKDEISGKTFYHKRQHVAQVLVVEDPLAPNKDTGETHQGQVRLISINKQLYDIIKDAISSEDAELEAAPYDLEEGYDFIIKKSKDGQYASYTVGTKFANKQRALTAEEIAAVEEHSVELKTSLPPALPSEKVQGMLEAALTGGSYEDGEAPVRPQRQAPRSESTETSPVRAAAPAPRTEAPAQSGGDADDSNVDDMLKRIQARRKSLAPKE